MEMLLSGPTMSRGEKGNKTTLATEADRVASARQDEGSKRGGKTLRKGAQTTTQAEKPESATRVQSTKPRKGKKHQQNRNHPTPDSSPGKRNVVSTAGGLESTNTKSQPSVPKANNKYGVSRQRNKQITQAGESQKIQDAEKFWRECTGEWYPKMHSQTYFLPPLYFNQMSFDVAVVADLPVLVPKEASRDTREKTPVYFPAVASPPHSSSDSPLAASVFSTQAVSPGPLPVTYHAYVKEDLALQKVLKYIDKMAKKEKEEAMLVLSQLNFRKYLDNQVDPITTAATRFLPRFDSLDKSLQRGDFDVLIISRHYGLIVGEVKAVGSDPDMMTDFDQSVLKRVDKSLKQLQKAEVVLGHLVSDIGPVRVIKILMLPYITSQQLLAAVSTDKKIQQALCQCVEVADTDPAAAVTRCLCADNIGSPSSDWWHQTVKQGGPDHKMTADQYEILVARFCGPATTVEVPTLTTPRRTVGLRTLSEAAALTGLTMSMITLYPEQVVLVSRPELSRVFLHGPPGTGKTVVLVLKALQWGHQGKDVHLLSSHKNSRAITFLIAHQLQHTPGVQFFSMPASGSMVQPELPPSKENTASACNHSGQTATETPDRSTRTEATDLLANLLRPVTLSADLTAGDSRAKHVSIPEESQAGVRAYSENKAAENEFDSRLQTASFGTASSGDKAVLSESEYDPSLEPAKQLPESLGKPGTPVQDSEAEAAAFLSSEQRESPRLYTHFYDFRENDGDLETAVKDLVSKARDEELYIIADEACYGYDYARGIFTQFCKQLAGKVPKLHIWAAAVERDGTETFFEEYSLTTPVRCPPAIAREVAESFYIDDRKVPYYSCSAAPSPTDGPAVLQISAHWKSKEDHTVLAGHAGEYPEECVYCGDCIADLIQELKIGQPGQGLQYSDVIILTRNPPQNDQVVASRLQAKAIPVHLVTSDDDVNALYDVAVAARDAVTMIAYKAISGLERRVVVILGRGGKGSDDGRLHAMSRCTSLLVWTGHSLPTP